MTVLAVGNTLLQALYKCPSLLALYFQNEDNSYKLDFNLRKLQIENGANRRDYWEEEDDDSDTAAASAGSTESTACTYDTVLTDHGLIVYNRVEHLKTDLKHPDSILYVEPYGTCTCGYKGKGKRLTKFIGKSM